MTGPKPVALPAWLHPSVTKISLKVEILQCVAISSHVFFPEPLRHPEGGARIPEEPEEGRAAAAHDGGEGSLPQELLPESAKTGKASKTGGSKLFSSQWMEEAPSRGF